MIILETKELNVYKKLLRALGSYSENFPATGVDKLFKSIVASGLKSIPKDKKALEILDRVLSVGSFAAAVQQILNLRFADLDMDVRPVYMTDRGTKEVAFWGKSGMVNDRVLSLVDFDGKGKDADWTDINGKKVDVIDVTNEKE